MEQPFLNELRCLRPHIRQAFIEGRQQYRDQIRQVRYEDETVNQLIRSGEM